MCTSVDWLAWAKANGCLWNSSLHHVTFYISGYRRFFLPQLIMWRAASLELHSIASFSQTIDRLSVCFIRGDIWECRPHELPV